MRFIARKVYKYPIPITLKEINASLQGPKILVNSLPKSGTFLLRRLLALMPVVAPRWSYHGLVAETPDLYKRISNIKRGQYLSGHLWWNQNLQTLLQENEIKVLHITRDLRDVASSLAQYLAIKNPKHRLHPYFWKLNPDERLLAAIQGVDSKVLGLEFGMESLAEQAENFLPWLNQANCLTVRFEDLIGPSGGGSEVKQLEAISLVLEHLNIDLDSKQINSIAKQVFFTQSKTFRKGQIGGWRNEFKEQHIEVFKETTGKILLELGYETGLDW